MLTSPHDTSMAPSLIALGKIRARTRPLLAVALLAATTHVVAMDELDDTAMTGVTGEGMSFAWTDFRMQMNPTSYIEQVGSDNTESTSCTGGGEPAGCRRRGDMRWFGTSVSATGTAVGQAVTAGAWNTSWTVTGGNMTQCTDAGYNGLGCPRGGPSQYFAAPDNPYILRVYDYAGDGDTATGTRTAIGNGIVTYEGNRAPGLWVPGAVSNETTNGSGLTVLEWLAPTRPDNPALAQDNYRFAFWGEIESGKNLATGAAGKGLLKSQTIVQGNAAGSALRFFKFTQDSRSPGQTSWNPLAGAPTCTDTGCAGVDTASSAFNNETLGIVYESYLQGDFRFSVAQAGTLNDTSGVPVVFHAREGMYFRNVRAFFPLGQRFYQAITLDVPRNAATNAPTLDGNFKLEIPLLPNRTAVFTRFYSLLTTPAVGSATVPSAWDYGYATARSWILHNTAGADVTNYPALNANYAKTHGFSRWGDWFPCGGVGCPNPPTTVPATRNAWNYTDDGILFANIAAYNAFAYRIDTIDTRTTADRSSFASTSVTNYADYAACTAAATGNNRYLCGYGGSYAAGAAAATSTAAIYHPADLYLHFIAYGNAPTAATRTVIPVPANSVLNIGDARVEAMEINFMRLTSLGAQY